MHWIVLAVLAGWVVGWALFGTPGKDIANVFWSEAVAPWEDVDATYYPAANLTDYERQPGLGSLEECREWVYQRAAEHGDPNLRQGDYECGVGFIRSAGPLYIYRQTLR